MDEEAVSHALDIFPFFRGTYIVRGQVGPEDGRLKHTPMRRQPRHHTFWKVYKREITAAFRVYKEPEPELGVGPEAEVGP